MINTNRIVPVEKQDLISLYGLILLQNSNNSGLTALQAGDPGVFDVTSAAAPLLAAEPVKSLDIDATASSISSATIYFVAAYDYAGFSIDGTKKTTLGAAVEADGVTLYKATLSSGDITIAKVGF